MRKLKKKWLSRALACALAVALTAGTAVMTPIADIIGTNITANAAGYTTWGNCQWKVENGKLYIKGTIPNTGGPVDIPWCAGSIRATITEVYVEKGTKTSANVSYLFYNLTKATSMNLSNLDTSAATDMHHMFNYCNSLASLNTSGWNTSKVTNMWRMFYYCKALTSLDLSSWNTSSVKTMEDMFRGCNALTSLNLSNWNTKNVTTMAYMFYGCNSLKSVDVNGWNTQNVTSMFCMFSGCKALKKIYADKNWNTSNVENDYSMFGNCENLVGGKGTAWIDTEKNKEYARIDGGPESTTPGYFTEGHAPLTYTVTWKNYDGTTLETDEDVEKGTMPEYNGTTPARTATAQYSYTFSGWDKAIAAVTGDVTYTAKFTETTNTYTVTWIDGDGNTLKTDTVAYGKTPVYSGATPTKEGNAQYTYTFSGWDKAIAAVTGNVTYTAQFSDTVNEYTVTWVDDDGNTLKTDTVAYGTTPTYDGTPHTKTTADGKKYAFAGWTDGTNTYTPNSLPNATGDVTYTAVFEEYDKDIAQNVGYYVGDKINFGDTYIKDYIWQNAKTYHISGVYTLVSAVYDSNKRYYIATLQSRNETIQLITDVYSDMGEQIAFVCTSGQGTERYPYQFQMKKYGTVIWKDEDGNVVETDEKVLNDARPSYDGEALTKESEEPDKYHYVLRWSKDNTNDPYEYDELFEVSFRDTDTVTYNAVFLKAQYVAENGVYFIGDTIDFNGKYVKMQDSGSAGVANFIRTIQNIQLYNASTGKYQVALHQSRSTGYYYFTVGENYGSKVAYVVKSGTGTQDDPYIMGIAPYFTVTWKNGEDIIETDEKVIEGDTPTYDSEMPTKASDGNYVYKFKGWTDGTNTYTAENLPAVGGNVTYTAVYDALPIIYSDDVFVNSTESTPEVVVTDPFTKEILTAGTDYTLEISEDTVKITGIGSYAGEVQKSYTTLSREVKASITNRRKIGNNAKVVLSSEWYLPKNATDIKAGIARLSTDDTNITKYDVYNNGVKKASTLKTTSGKYSFSLLMNSTHANQNLYAVTYVTYEIDGKEFISLSNVFTSYANLVA